MKKLYIKIVCGFVVVSVTVLLSLHIALPFFAYHGCNRTLEVIYSWLPSPLCIYYAKSNLSIARSGKLVVIRTFCAIAKVVPTKVQKELLPELETLFISNDPDLRMCAIAIIHETSWPIDESLSRLVLTYIFETDSEWYLRYNCLRGLLSGKGRLDVLRRILDIKTCNKIIEANIANTAENLYVRKLAIILVFKVSANNHEICRKLYPYLLALFPDEKFVLLDSPNTNGDYITGNPSRNSSFDLSR